MGDAWPSRLRRVFLRLHLVLAVVPLIYLASALGNTSTTGFRAERSLYPDGSYLPYQVRNFILRSWPGGRARGRVITIWGLADDPSHDEIEETTRSIRLIDHLVEESARLNLNLQLRVVSPLAEQAKQWLPAKVKVMSDPVAALQGAHGVMLACARPEYLAVSAETIAAGLRGMFFFDLTGKYDGGAIDRTGLHYMNYGPPIGPPWLDPELLEYTEYLRAKVPEGDGMLLIPVLPPESVAGRNRWFLFLNEQLLPRRLYLWRTEEATATSVQFRQWALDYREFGPWQETRRWQPAQREITGVRQTGPVRTLSAAERAAVEELDVQWVTFFRLNADFRFQDWETLPVATALAGGEESP